MQLNFMRLVDFWIGIPLCGLLSCYNTLTRHFKKSTAARGSPIRKILFIKLSEMGALTFTYPLLKNLKKEYPEAELYFLVFHKNVSALSLLDGMVPPERIFTIKDSSFAAMITTAVNAIKAIRAERFDAAVDLEFFARITSILTFLSSAPRRVGFFRYHFEGLYRGNLLTHKVQYNPLLHCSRSYLSLGFALKEGDRKETPEFRTLISDEDIMLPVFHPTPAGQSGITQKLQADGCQTGQKLFLLNPGEGTLPLREWPLENFIELSKRILADSTHTIVIIGWESSSNKDRLLHEAVNHPRCINLVNKTSMDELLELFCLSYSLIINDCGLAHLAAMTPIRKFVFFGPETPQVFGPLGVNTHIFYSHAPCSPCLSVLNHRNSSCRDNQCLKVIGVEEVWARVSAATV